MSDVELLTERVRAAFGSDFVEWPGGWPGEIDAALIDAVFSIRARYGSQARGTGVAGVVARWRNGRGSADDLGALAAMPYEEFAGIVANASTTGGHRKDLTVQRAAANLHRAGVTAHSDFDPDSDAQRHAYTRTPGCGAVTWSYLCMLLGEPDVKPDTQVMRFVDDALLRKVSPAQARVLLNGAASEIGIDARRLDHSIWAYQRSKHPHD